MKKSIRKSRKKISKTNYSLEDYNSGDGMLTSVWGPALWFFLHTMSFNYPVQPTEEQKHHYRDFVLSLQNILPCKYCRINLEKNLKVLPLTMNEMKNRHTFSKYVYDLHEHVNQMLNKKSNLTYEQVRDTYENFRARCVQEKKKVCSKSSSKKKEKGCTTPFYGKKSRCVIKIVPAEKKCETFQINKKCKLKKSLRK